jgi:hypothetical protein
MVKPVPCSRAFTIKGWVFTIEGWVFTIEGWVFATEVGCHH